MLTVPLAVTAEQVPTPAIPTPGVPTLAAELPTVGAQAELAILRDQIATLQNDHVKIQEHTVSLDGNVDTHRLDRKQILELMRDLTTVLGEVRSELDQHRDTVATVSAEISRQQSENDRLLADVEQQLQEVLARYDPDQ